MSAPRTTIASLSRDIRSEADAYRYWESLRWGDNPRCAHCGADGEDVYLIPPANGTSRKTAAGSMSERRVWKCRPCKKQFSVLTGTIMHATKVPIRTWVLVTFDACSAKNGISAREVERKYGVCPRTAWHMLHRIRQAMAGGDRLVTTMRGTVVADETWVGGEPKNRHAKDRSGVKGLTDKTPVLSLVNQVTGEVRSKVVPTVTANNLRKFMSEQVDMSASELWTDSAKHYGAIGGEFARHQAVDHSKGEYVNRKGAGTNLAEGFFSQLKRSITGTHHHVSVEHLGRYCGEFDYRYSTCKMSDHGRVRTLAKQMEGRLSYKRLTEKGQAGWDSGASSPSVWDVVLSDVS